MALSVIKAPLHLQAAQYSGNSATSTLFRSAMEAMKLTVFIIIFNYNLLTLVSSVNGDSEKMKHTTSTNTIPSYGK